MSGWFILEPTSRDRGPILVCDKKYNDVAEFFHNEHATVDQSYETALAYARSLVKSHAAPQPAPGWDEATLARAICRSDKGLGVPSCVMDDHPERDPCSFSNCRRFEQAREVIESLATKSEGSTEGRARCANIAQHADTGLESAGSSIVEAGINPGPSDRTADVTTDDLVRVIKTANVDFGGWETDLARALLDTYKVSRP